MKDGMRQVEFDKAAHLAKVAEKARKICINNGTHTTQDGYCIECIRGTFFILEVAGVLAPVIAEAVDFIAAKERSGDDDG